ncbi:hypothetical protein RFI_33841 [Reticulomyxa filosa]|uniref:Uncharacterized protein n=1 Tax=Reticulomyxa filosa TaxID=46433 RepID=X6LQ92_RETFI|nr:hypothetical protein RFI_33841 [Reticulomyxa filosa]|eukprot:ETO03561.1 hypothetical protein RFI_33841 [Reticulomyxa filosa]
MNMLNWLMLLQKIFKIRRNKNMEVDGDDDDALLDDTAKSRRLLDDISSDFPFDKPKKVEVWWNKCKKHVEKIVQKYKEGETIHNLEVHKHLVNEIVSLASQDVFNPKCLKKAKEWQKVLKKRLRKSMKPSLNEDKLDLFNNIIKPPAKSFVYFLLYIYI